jgi:predicted membrane metal-binding protein
MVTYHQIKAKELKTTASYSSKKLANYIKSHKILLFFYSVKFFWTFSFLTFMTVPYFINNSILGYVISIIFHMVAWNVHIINLYHKHTDKDKEELTLVIEVLKDIQKEKKEA